MLIISPALNKFQGALPSAHQHAPTKSGEMEIQNTL